MSTVSIGIGAHAGAAAWNTCLAAYLSMKLSDAFCWKASRFSCHSPFLVAPLSVAGGRVLGGCGRVSDSCDLCSAAAAASGVMTVMSPTPGPHSPMHGSGTAGGSLYQSAATRCQLGDESDFQGSSVTRAVSISSNSGRVRGSHQCIRMARPSGDHDQPLMSGQPSVGLATSRSARHACHDQVRRRPRWTSSDVPRGYEPTGPDPIAPIADRDALERALSRLPLVHRTVLALRFLLDLTPDEIAETLGVPRKTVYSRLHRAVEAMRAAMDADSRLPTRGPVPGEAVR